MNSSEQKDDRLMRILKQAYLGKERLDAGGRLQEGVMRRIRRMDPVKVAPVSSIGFSQFTWKLAPVTILLIFALTAFLIASGLGSDPFEFPLDGTETMALVELIQT